MGVELASMGETKPADADDEVVVYREPAQRHLQEADRPRRPDRRRHPARRYRSRKHAHADVHRRNQGAGTPRGSALRLADRRVAAESLRSSGQRADLQLQRRQQDSRSSTPSRSRAARAFRRSAPARRPAWAAARARAWSRSFSKPIVGEVGYDPTEHYYVPGVPLEKSQLVAEIRNRGIKSVSEVFAQLADGKEDPASKVGLASLLKTLWPGEYEDERDARFINDRVHANIQKDGTFSVVPRIYGGVTTRG